MGLGYFKVMDLDNIQNFLFCIPQPLVLEYIYMRLFTIYGHHFIFCDMHTYILH